MNLIINLSKSTVVKKNYCYYKTAASRKLKINAYRIPAVNLVLVI